VVFSDGKDTVSRASIESAIEAAKAARAPVVTVALETADFDRAALERIASETEGSSFSVAQSGDLSSAFGQVARDIASTYVLTYSASRTQPADLDLAVTVATAGGRETDTITVSNPRVAAPAEPDAPQPAGSPGILSSAFGLYLGIGAAFGALALLLGTLVLRPTAGGLQVLRKSLRLSTRAAAKKEDRGVVASNLARRAVELVEKAPKPKGFEERLQLKLEQAGWPVRASEFLVLQVLAAVLCGLVGAGLLGSVLVGVLLAAVGFWVPRLVLSQRVQRRASAFLSQLPETLQLLAGSLQAGYGILQAIDMVAKESPSPTSSEFARVLTEARLGMPLEEALEAMAERLGSEDFRWVVMAINIQRQVGGNLAQLLTTVAATLREREQLRRQVKVLSAEGRLSAVILTLLPFVLAGYMAIVNPEYLGVLLQSGIGKLMIVVALGMIGVGVVWMRKMIRIEI
jgi:tight adherence protein B